MLNRAVPADNPPIVLIFSPFDPSGATGLPAEAVTCAEFGCHAVSVLTGMLVQDTAVTEHIEAMTPELMDDQARCLLEDMPVHAMKVGPLYTTESVSVLAQITADYSQIPLVVHLQRSTSLAMQDEFDSEETPAALLELVLPQTDLVIAGHTLLQQWQSHGLLPGTTPERAVEAILEYGASALLVCGTPVAESRAGYLLRDENGETMQWPGAAADTVLGTDELLATCITTQLARGKELAAAVDRGIAALASMSARAFQPGMGGRIYNRSRS